MSTELPLTLMHFKAIFRERGRLCDTDTTLLCSAETDEVTFESVTTEK